jgi:hypothetical protein
VNIELAALADYAAVTADGKLVVAGVFDALLVPALPVSHPMMYLALRISGDASETGRHELEIRLVDPDGKPVIPSLRGGLELPTVATGGAKVSAQLVMGMGNVSFGSQGPHAFDILIDERYELSVSVDVRLAPASPGE